MRRPTLAVLVMALLTSIPSIAFTQYAPETAKQPDLGIGRGYHSNRPNILVAWRNTERILEVEILVRNLSDQEGRGTVRLEICDEEGRKLLATEPFEVTVPARGNGGQEGTIVQTKGFRMMNIMFDELDRLDQRYKLRAIVQTDGDDINLLDNVATKSFNVEGRAFPAATSTYRYRIANTSGQVKTTHVFMDNTPVPAGWVMTSSPAVGTEITLQPNEVFTGYVTVTTPKQIKEGDFIDLQVGLAEDVYGKQVVLDKDEWFLVATSAPPQVDKPTVKANADGTVTVNVAAHDPISGIKEASGVQVAYSLDQGTTFSTRVMAYTRGDFYDKTWFEGTLGPFAPGVNITAVLTVANNAGIVHRIDLPPVRIPSDPNVTR